MAALLPLAFLVEYMDGAWLHILVLAMTVDGQRLVSMFSTNARDGVRRSFTSWHGVWGFLEPFGTLPLQSTPIVSVWVNYRGNNARLRQRSFYVSEVRAHLIWGHLLALEDAEAGWPGYVQEVAAYDMVSDWTLDQLILPM